MPNNLLPVPSFPHRYIMNVLGRAQWWSIRLQIQMLQVQIPLRCTLLWIKASANWIHFHLFTTLQVNGFNTGSGWGRKGLYLDLWRGKRQGVRMEVCDVERERRNGEVEEGDSPCRGTELSWHTHGWLSYITIMPGLALPCTGPWCVLVCVWQPGLI